MDVIYAGEDAPKVISKSIFLAGPSSRGCCEQDLNWRVKALRILEMLGFDGTVFVPLPRNREFQHSYINQAEWETTHLNLADIILFWVPRDLERMPGFTTNVEWGIWCGSGKVTLGYPDYAQKTRYLAYHAEKNHIPVHHSLVENIKDVVSRLGDGSERVGGEREVPLHIWKLNHFQNWYEKQKLAGNRLDGARLLWSFRVGPEKSLIFAFALHVNVYIAKEGRNKINEFIISRPDVAALVAYHRGKTLADTDIAIVKEFRSTARTDDGYVREVPGGSSWKPGLDPLDIIIHEVKEETGLVVDDKNRIRRIGSRQLSGTFSTHIAYVFAMELTDSELEFLRKQQSENVIHGVEAETERTYVEVQKLGDLMKRDSNAIDWSTLGMIFAAIH